MNLNELHIKLKESGISEDLYYLHGLYGSTNEDNKLALKIKKGGTTLNMKSITKREGGKAFDEIIYNGG